MDEILARSGSMKPRLLLHSCCGPCSSSVLEDLSRFFQVTLFWYNPNIFPQEEFDRRLSAQKKLLQAMDPSGRIALLEIPSTLTLSRHKDPVRINALGEQFAREYGVRWLPSEFKKRGRELRSKELCEQYGIYRQNYCGCEFSLHPTKTTNEVQP